MDLLPKHMCHRCSYKLEEFHKFYIECLKTDTALKNQLSWMRKDSSKEKIGIPMVQIENVKIKCEPIEMNPLLESVGLVEYPVSGVQTMIPDCIMYTSFANSSHCQYCNKSDPTSQLISKECTHPHLGLRNRSEISYRFTGPRNSNTLWENEKRKFFYSVKPPSNSQKNSKGRKSSSNSKGNNYIDQSLALLRNLRPRKQSVDYVGKRKISESYSDNRTIDNDVTLVKEDSSRNKSPRSLRSRKVTQFEFDSQRNRSKYFESQSNCRSKNIESCKKRIDTLPNQSFNSVEKFVEVEIKREVMDDSDFDQKFGAGSQHLEDVDLRNSIYKSHLKDEKNQCLNTKKKNYLGIEELKKKELLRLGKIKKNSKKRLSSKNLRSQYLHLRSGKVKIADVSNSKNLKKDLKNGRVILEKLNDSFKMKSIKISNMGMKHLCEKCNFSFANKELFKLHACYGN